MGSWELSFNYHGFQSICVCFSLHSLSHFVFCCITYLTYFSFSNSNIGSLAQLVKDGTRTTVQPAQEQVHGMQLQQQSSIRQPTQEQVHGMQLQQQSSIRQPTQEQVHGMQLQQQSSIRIPQQVCASEFVFLYK